MDADSLLFIISILGSISIAGGLYWKIKKVEKLLRFTSFFVLIGSLLAFYLPGAITVDPNYTKYVAESFPKVLKPIIWSQVSGFASLIIIAVVKQISKKVMP